MPESTSATAEGPSELSWPIDFLSFWTGEGDASSCPVVILELRSYPPVEAQKQKRTFSSTALLRDCAGRSSACQLLVYVRCAISEDGSV
jgi:hypothetical protein